MQRPLELALDTGTQAPDFTLPDQDGEEVELSSFRGRPVVLYFYPKADTPGCTTQACSIRDHADAYAARDAVVLGVSPDPAEKVKKFHEKFSMNFTLLADADHGMAEQVRRLGREVDVRQDLLGEPARDVRHRPGRDGRPRAAEGLAEDP